MCRHPDQAEIEAALLQGASQRATARAYALSATAVGEHVRNGHISAATAQVVRAVEHVQSAEVLGQTVTLYERVLAILTEAEHERDPKTALDAVKEARQLLSAMTTVSELREREESAAREAAIEAAPDLDAEIRAWIERTQGSSAFDPGPSPVPWTPPELLPGEQA